MEKLLHLLALAVVTSAANLPSNFNSQECGIAPTSVRGLRALARNFGGVNTSPGSHPWMAYIYDVSVGQIDGYICGGTLINSEWIVTAAHCIVKPDTPETYRIILGEHKASSRSGLERDFKISEVIQHELYDPLDHRNDIALLKLARPVLLSDYIHPVCLPDQGFPTDANSKSFHRGQYLSYAGKTCTVVGWSETETKWKSDVLKEQSVTILPKILCTAVTMQDVFYPTVVTEDDTRFCAGGILGQDLCSIQGGGPLLCKDDSGRYHLHGITTFGPEPCGHPLHPSVFTEVSAFSDWIAEAMGY